MDWPTYFALLPRPPTSPLTISTTQSSSALPFPIIGPQWSWVEVPDDDIGRDDDMTGKAPNRVVTTTLDDALVVHCVGSIGQTKQDALPGCR
jgi:hypothetical protein